MTSITFAWVTLVMQGDSYIPGATTMAHSLKYIAKTKYPVVCMYTDDVSREGIEILSSVFDKIILVPYLQCRTSKFRSDTQKDRYEKWIDKSFTKWNCLSFSHLYNKVILLDADTLVLKNCDELFDVTAPAGHFSRPNAKPFIPNGIYNPYKDYMHGYLIPASVINEGLNSSFVLYATSVILEPKDSVFEEIISCLSQYNDQVDKDKEFGYVNCLSGHDEQFIVHLYTNVLKENWTQISTIYNCIPWESSSWLQCQGNGEGEEDIKISHFIGYKPWDSTSPKKWREHDKWWSIAMSSHNNNNNILVNNLLKPLHEKYESSKEKYKTYVGFLLRNVYRSSQFLDRRKVNDAKMIQASLKHNKSINCRWIRHFNQLEKDRKSLSGKLSPAHTLIGFSDEHANQDFVIQTIIKWKKERPEGINKLYWVIDVDGRSLTEIENLKDIVDFWIVRSQEQKCSLIQYGKVQELKILIWSNSWVNVDMLSSPLNIELEDNNNNNNNNSIGSFIGYNASIKSMRAINEFETFLFADIDNKSLTFNKLQTSKENRELWLDDKKIKDYLTNDVAFSIIAFDAFAMSRKPFYSIIESIQSGCIIVITDCAYSRCIIGDYPYVIWCCLDARSRANGQAIYQNIIKYVANNNNIDTRTQRLKASQKWISRQMENMSKQITQIL